MLLGCAQKKFAKLMPVAKSLFPSRSWRQSTSSHATAMMDWRRVRSPCATRLSPSPTDIALPARPGLPDRKQAAGKPGRAAHQKSPQPALQDPTRTKKMQYLALRADKPRTQPAVRCRTESCVRPEPAGPRVRDAQRSWTIRVPSNPIKRASQAGCAGQAGAVTRLPSTWA